MVGNDGIFAGEPTSSGATEGVVTSRTNLALEFKGDSPSVSLRDIHLIQFYGASPKKSLFYT